MAEQNYQSVLKRIADALEGLLKLSTPVSTSPMVKKLGPTYPYPDAPLVRGMPYYGSVTVQNEGFIDSQ